MPPPDTELYRLTASEVASHLRAGSFTVEVYIRSLLSRIEAREPRVKAWAHLDEDLVISQAQRLDQIPLHQRGPLHVIPLGVKDVIYTIGDLEPKQAYGPSLLTSLARYANTAQLPHTRWIRDTHGRGCDIDFEKGRCSRIR